jgi:hypothetical protein
MSRKGACLRSTLNKRDLLDIIWYIDLCLGMLDYILQFERMHGLDAQSFQVVINFLQEGG